jgi:hypothetical protein
LGIVLAGGAGAWSAAVALFGAMLGEGPDRNTTGRSEYQKI